MLCICSPEWRHSKREHGTHCFVHVVTFPGIPRVIFTITVLGAVSLQHVNPAGRTPHDPLLSACLQHDIMQCQLVVMATHTLAVD